MNKDMTMHDYIEKFVEQVRNDEVEVYNEFSLQHELGFFLRESFNPQKSLFPKVQFERPASYFFPKQKFKKKEIDICIFNSDKIPNTAIELKFPGHETTDQMFYVCKDIKFLEELLEAGFKKAYALIFTDFKGFYYGKEDAGIKIRAKKMYSYFRFEEPLNGLIEKPTSENQLKKQNGDPDKVNIKGNYQVKWHDIKETENSKKSLKYAIIEIKLPK